MLTVLYVLGSGLALFLAGANAAFLINLGRVLTGWFVMKIIAITGIMLYMAMSMYIGNPGLFRASVGVVFLIVDAAALGYMWLGIERMRSQGVTGLIPIARLTPSDE